MRTLTCIASHLEKLARLYRRVGENAAALVQHRERAFTHLEEDNGMVSFRVRLPAEQAAVVLKAIEAAKASLDGQVKAGCQDGYRFTGAGGRPGEAIRPFTWPGS